MSAYETFAGPLPEGRPPYWKVADLLGVSCADRTHEVIAEEMCDALNDRFMRLPIDSEGQPVNPGESVIVDLRDGEYSGKVIGVGRHNRIVVDMPRWNVSHGYDIYHPQSMNAHYVRQNPYWEEA